MNEKRGVPDGDEDPENRAGSQPWDGITDNGHKRNLSVVHLQALNPPANRQCDHISGDPESTTPEMNRNQTRRGPIPPNQPLYNILHRMRVALSARNSWKTARMP